MAAQPGYGMVETLPILQNISHASSQVTLDVLHIFSPEELSQWLKKNIKFKEDPDLFGKEDYWQSPEEFMARKAGDCEDYAVFSQSILKQLGIESYIVSFYGPGDYAHTVLLYEEKGLYQILNQDKIQKFNAKTVEGALSKIYPEWTWGSIAEVYGKRGRMALKLENPLK